MVEDPIEHRRGERAVAVESRVPTAEGLPNDDRLTDVVLSGGRRECAFTICKQWRARMKESDDGFVEAERREDRGLSPSFLAAAALPLDCADAKVYADRSMVLKDFDKFDLICR